MTCAHIILLAVTVIVIVAFIVNEVRWEREFTRRCDETKKFYLDLMK